MHLTMDIIMTWMLTHILSSFLSSNNKSRTNLVQIEILKDYCVICALSYMQNCTHVYWTMDSILITTFYGLMLTLHGKEHQHEDCKK